MTLSEKKRALFLLIVRNLDDSDFQDGKFLFELEDGSTIPAPSKKIVCPECEGCGTELMPGLKGEAFTEEDMRDLDWSYFSGAMADGRYDVPCSQCKGQNVIDVPDLENVDPGQIDKLLEFFEEIEAQRSADYWEAEGERRMGA